MRSAEVYYNDELAGVITETTRNKYLFRYDDAWFINDRKPPVSLTMTKNRQEYESDSLFPVFFNLLSEGANKSLQCSLLKIDENDFFGLLMATARYDTIGAITIRPIL
jgi:serine/threonine-protein kinase HipA